MKIVFCDFPECKYWVPGPDRSAAIDERDGRCTRETIRMWDGAKRGEPTCSWFAKKKVK